MAAGHLTVVVSAMLAAVPRQGGWSWAVLQYLLGLRHLGHHIHFVEPISRASLVPREAPLSRSDNADYFRHVTAEFGLEGAATLLLAGTRETVGVPYAELRQVSRRADVLLNLSGWLADGELTDGIPLRVYVDLDPAFTQLWHATQGIDMRFGGHTHFVTIGQAIGQPDCPVPTCGLPWIPSWPPVVLAHWPVAKRITHHGFTTIANWRGYGSIDHGGVRYGQKAHSLRPLVELPERTGARLILAVAIHPEERADLAALRRHGWELLDPAEVTATPEAYRRFVQGSQAELGIAKSGYVAARCGWFSDRSVCYLASGRPVLAQETGFSRFLPTGQGLLAFGTLDEALRGIEALRADYGRHARAARAIAEEHFDSERVLGRLLKRIGAAP